MKPHVVTISVYTIIYQTNPLNAYNSLVSGKKIFYGKSRHPNRSHSDGRERCVDTGPDDVLTRAGTGRGGTGPGEWKRQTRGRGCNDKETRRHSQRHLPSPATGDNTNAVSITKLIKSTRRPHHDEVLQVVCLKHARHLSPYCR